MTELMRENNKASSCQIELKQTAGIVHIEEQNTQFLIVFLSLFNTVTIGIRSRGPSKTEIITHLLKKQKYTIFSSFFFLPNLPKFTCTSSGRVKVFTFLSILIFSVPKRKRMDSMVKSWVDKLKPCLPKDKAIVIFLHRQPAPLPLLFFPHTLSNVAPTNVTT